MRQAMAGEEVIKNRGWSVTFTGMGINLALGILYTWSVISGRIPDDWNWTQSDKAWPYAIACLVFSLVMVPAGRMQDKLSPRLVATIGGLFVGLGMIAASRTTSPVGFMIGFGLLAGAGIGFGYASATPPAVKWFPAAKTGLIAGIVVSGFGLASVYAAPLTTWLIRSGGLPNAVLILGIGFLIVVVVLAQFLKPPHKVLQFGNGSANSRTPLQETSAARSKKEDFTSREMLRTWQFYLLWFMYACGAGAGLMIIGVAKKIGAQAEVGVALVTGLAIGNGAGRILAGVASDKIGRNTTMCIFFVLQAVLVFLLSLATGGNFLATASALVVMAAMIGASYGANLSLFPSVTKDYYGARNFGTNYGLVFTAWGIGGYLLSRLAGMVYDGKIVEAWKGGFNFAYYAAAGLLITAAMATSLLKAPHHHEQPAEVAV